MEIYIWNQRTFNFVIYKKLTEFWLATPERLCSLSFFAIVVPVKADIHSRHLQPLPNHSETILNESLYSRYENKYDPLSTLVQTEV